MNITTLQLLLLCFLINIGSVKAERGLPRKQGTKSILVTNYSKRLLIIDNSATALLSKVPVNNSKEVHLIKTDQFFLGDDGLLLKSADSLIIVVNGRNDKILKLVSSDIKLADTARSADRFTDPAPATINTGQVWIVNARLINCWTATRFGYSNLLFRKRSSSQY